MDLFGLMNAAQKCAAFFFENVCVEHLNGRIGRVNPADPATSAITNY
jgi:hypothetical protein